MNLTPYFLTLGATLSFSSASLVFAKFSRSVSVIWMNTAKAFVAFCLLTVQCTLLALWADVWQPPSWLSAGTLFASGALGLGIGDLFLLGAFVHIGVSRTLMLYGFQPLILVFAGAAFFGQTFEPHRWIAIVFLIACLLIFSLERYRETKSWQFQGLLMALIGVTLDSSGVLMTRFAFEQSPHTAPLEGHLIRCAGALTCYALVAAFLHLRRRLKGSLDRTPVIGLFSRFRALTGREKGLILLGCFGGTYLSLSLYLTAIQTGHLASISAIAITGPMFAAFLETVIQKKRPSRYLLLALACFIGGFSVLVFT
ncbi:MAG: DMT family transporter [Bdellovibrionales bacterium]|jgi:drug/metabolite transporter (DMT)-like permease|nr:DMT family transporter [Bdellovibrionales bacterium]